MSVNGQPSAFDKRSLIVIIDCRFFRTFSLTLCSFTMVNNQFYRRIPHKSKWCVFLYISFSSSPEIKASLSDSYLHRSSLCQNLLNTVWDFYSTEYFIFGRYAFFKNSTVSSITLSSENVSRPCVSPSMILSVTCSMHSAYLFAPSTPTASSALP